MILAEIITRLKSQMVINLLITFFGLITTVLTVRLYGLSVFGELVVINAVIGMLTIINLIIPPNYSVYKLQDDPKFINILLSVNFLLAVFIIAISSIYFYHILNGFAFICSVIYSLFLALQSFVDVYCQSKNKLTQYYFLVLSMAIVKFLAIALLSFNTPDLTGLLAAYTLAQVAMIIVSAVYIKKSEPQLRCALDYSTVISFFRENINSLKGYYLSAILKRVNDNSLPLIFSVYLTKSEIGLFTLLQKSLAMGVTFLRVFEAALFHRETAKVIDGDLRKFIPLLLLTHLAVLVCGTAYIYFSIEILMYELALISLLLYPLALTVTFRAKLFGQYNTLVVNTAALLSLTVFIISVWVMNFMGLSGLMIAILSYSLLVIINAVVIYFGWRIINNEK